MLSWDEVTRYVKGHLSLPSTYIEEADEKLIEWMKETAHLEFSSVQPNMEVTGVLVDDSDYKVSGSDNTYYFFDDETLPIIGIRQCYFSVTNDMLTGHPLFGPVSMQSAKWWALNVFQSRFIKSFSMFSKTYHFKSPNMVQVLPEADDNFVVEYERVHPYDLRTIDVSLYMDYKDLCLAHVMLKIGRLRSHYGGDGIQTPFGTIPLNGQELKNEGMELRRDVMERLREDALPPIYIDVD